MVNLASAICRYTPSMVLCLRWLCQTDILIPLIHSAVHLFCSITQCAHATLDTQRVLCHAEERFSLKGSEVSGSLSDVVRFVQRTLRKRPTPTMTLLGAHCC